MRDGREKRKRERKGGQEETKDKEGRRDGRQSENDRGQNEEKKTDRSRAVLTQRGGDSKIGEASDAGSRPAAVTDLPGRQPDYCMEASMDHGRALTPLCVHSGEVAVVDFERRRGNHMLTKSGFHGVKASLRNAVKFV
ncbi:hypothetical protein RF55_765 [Lasius niger]|uniref:Uncharacterized protein n=1 Tax=Lasius niger TaxID=67767 RepID=A0A0J7L885_LASNI|nr:hypothetical protein RF55_765 [Lasius niger]